MEITGDQRKKVKSEGFLSNKDGEHFSARVITENGVVTHKQLQCICEVSEKYGNGNISFTTRLTIEIPGIKFSNIENVKQYLQKEDLSTGGTGALVRPVVACKGTVCQFGLIDTQKIAEDLHKRFYLGYRNVTLPHKFKIAVGGCPNNCVKPDLNDLGIVGQMKPNYNDELCKNCKKCTVNEVCPMNAASITNGRLVIDKEICNNCGLCIGKCNFNVITHGEEFYKIYIGGRWGKRIRIGSPINKLFCKDDAMEFVEKSILLYKDKGVRGERFSQVVERLGIEELEKVLISNEIIERKEEILQINAMDGASY